MLAEDRRVGNANLRGLATLFFLYLHPELTGIRLRRRIGHPVVITMLVLAHELAVMATDAAIEINNKGLHISYAPSTILSRAI